MRFASIASGSSGNCSYIGTDHTHILVDAGIACKRIDGGLSDLGVNPNEIDGILITHEHSDHIQGLRVFTRKHPVPVYATAGTIAEIKKLDKKGELDLQLFHAIEPEGRFFLKEMEICPFSISHDAADPVGYRIDTERYSVGIATDLGTYGQNTISHLLHLDALLLEANHDVRMLEAGPYPFPLKRRILGDRGHLSNENAGRLLNELLHDDMKHIFLGHISKENNFPELAYETVRFEIESADTPYHAGDFAISTAARDSMSEVVCLGE